jgi:hypothetical protein
MTSRLKEPGMVYIPDIFQEGARANASIVLKRSPVPSHYRVTSQVPAKINGIFKKEGMQFEHYSSLNQ